MSLCSGARPGLLTNSSSFGGAKISARRSTSNLMKNRRAVECQQTTANQHEAPGGKGGSGDQLGGERCVGPGGKDLHLAELRRAIEEGDIDARDRHEGALPPEGGVVKVLLRESRKEHDPGEQVH